MILTFARINQQNFTSIVSRHFASLLHSAVAANAAKRARSRTYVGFSPVRPGSVGGGSLSGFFVEHHQVQVSRLFCFVEQCVPRSSSTLYKADLDCR